MSKRSIYLTAEEVRAVLAGNKTQIRRPIKHPLTSRGEPTRGWRPHPRKVGPYGVHPSVITTRIQRTGSVFLEKRKQT